MSFVESPEQRYAAVTGRFPCDCYGRCKCLPTNPAPSFDKPAKS
jgi:hypothetical protein